MSNLLSSPEFVGAVAAALIAVWIPASYLYLQRKNRINASITLIYQYAKIA